MTFLEGAAVWAAIFSLLQILSGGIYMSIYQLRDIDRARGLLEGHPAFFGSELSGGGHLPGGFYYLLIAPAVAIGGWKGVWEWELALLAAAGACAWLYARRRFGLLPACLVLLSAFTSNLLLGNAEDFVNPSFLPVFVVAAVICLCETFGHPTKTARRGWLAFCLICGLGIQLHATFLFILSAGIALQCGARRLKLTPVERGWFFAGLAFFLAPLLPYGLWLACRKSAIRFGRPDLPFTGTDALGWRFLFGAWSSKFQKTNWRDCAESLRRLMPVGAWIAGLLVAAARKVAGAEAGSAGFAASGRRFARDCSKILAVAAAFAFLPCLVPVLLRFHAARYASCLSWTAGFLLGAAAARKERAFLSAAGAGVVSFAFLSGVPWRPVVGAGVLAAVLFARPRSDSALPAVFATTILPLLLALGIVANRQKVDDGLNPETVESAMRQIRAQTGWTYDEMARRMICVNVEKEWTPAMIYRDVEARSVRRDRRQTREAERIDGYFLGAADSARGAPRRASDPWPLNEEIEDSFRRGIREGRIRLGRRVRYGDVNLVPYRILDREGFPRYAYNRSDGYSLAKDDSSFGQARAAGYRRIFNDCPRNDPAYDLQADVRIAAAGRRRWEVGIVLSGEPISQSASWVSPDCTERILNPYFGYSCGGVARRVVLADSLGFDRDAWITGRGLLAPYARDFHVACRGALDRLAVGYESAEVYSRDPSAPVTLPGKEQPIRN